MRKWSDGEQDDEPVCTRSARTRRSAGFRAREGSSLAVGDGVFDCREDRLHGAQSLNEWPRRRRSTAPCVANSAAGGLLRPPHVDRERSTRDAVGAVSAHLRPTPAGEDQAHGQKSSH